MKSLFHLSQEIPKWREKMKVKVTCDQYKYSKDGKNNKCPCKFLNRHFTRDMMINDNFFKLQELSRQEKLARNKKIKKSLEKANSDFKNTLQNLK